MGAHTKLFRVLFEWMTDHITNPLTPNDWIAGDPDIVADHASDLFNNFASPPNIAQLTILS